MQQYGGDRVLLELDDEAPDGALGLTARLPDGTGRASRRRACCHRPREPMLVRELAPTHEFFQVLEREAVKFNRVPPLPR